MREQQVDRTTDRPTDKYRTELLLEVAQVVVVMWTALGEELEPRPSLVAGRQHLLCRPHRIFTKAQMRKFFHTMKALTSYHDRYREPQQRFAKPQTGLYSCTVGVA